MSKGKQSLGKGLKNPYVQYLLFGIILLSFPYLTEAGILPAYLLRTYGFVMIYAIAALGLNLLLGYSGLASLGTAGFIGFSGYLTISLVHDLSLPYAMAVVVAILVPLALGLVVGFISLRIDGMYLAIATLIVGEIMRTSFVQLTSWTNGASGRGLGYPKLMLLGQLNRAQTFSLIAIVLVLMMVVTYNLIRGKTGRALVAMRGSSAAAQAMGINLVRYRLLAFGLATVYAAVAGIMWASYSTRIYPSEWSLGLSLNLLAVVVVGGIKSIWGTVLGSVIIYSSTTIIADLAQKIPNYAAIKSQLSGLPSIFTGVLIIVVIIVYPYGLIYIGRDIKRLYTFLKSLTKKRGIPGDTDGGHS